MYRPEHFREDRRDVLLAAMRDIQFAALVTPTADDIAVTHVPIVAHERELGIVLETHVARANAHWKAPTPEAAGRTVAIFQGPQAYVTPSWYPSKKEHGKVVPTWAYVVVHAHGTLEAIEESDWLRRHLEELTARNEAHRSPAWQISDAPESFVRSMTRGIVGLHMAVDRLEGVRKVNQHKGAADRAGTAEGLSVAGEAGARLAEVLRE